MEAVEVKRSVLVLVAIAVSAFGGGSFLTPRPVIASRMDWQAAKAAHARGGHEDIDAYGNEVTNAVAEYSFDDAGDLYELHSPQTELPRLGSPKS
jgi:hypothetical protein